MLPSLPMILTPLKEPTPRSDNDQEVCLASDTEATDNLTAGTRGTSVATFSCTEHDKDKPVETNLPAAAPSFADPEISSSVAENVLVSGETEPTKPPQEQETEDRAPQLAGSEELSKKKDNGNELTASAAVQSASKNPSANSAKKKSKHIRDVENNLKLLAPENEDVRNDKALGFAQAYFAKVSERLKGKDDGLYQEFLLTMHNFGQSILTVPELYLRISNIFHKHSDLANDFLTFLLPEQAVECGKFMEHLTLTRMRNFIRMLEVYFAKQPQQIRKICTCLAALSNQSDVTIKNVRSSVIPLLKGNTLLIDTFLELLPIEPPPESIISEFEELNCGHVSNHQSLDDQFANVEVPDQGDMYGGEHCVCACHANNDENFQKRAVHCTSCGIKFLHGRVFMQTGKSLRPAKVSFDDDPSNTHRRLALVDHPKKCIRKRAVVINGENGHKKFQKGENTSPKSCKTFKSKIQSKKINYKGGKECVGKSKTSLDLSISPTSDERLSSHDPSENCVEVCSPSTLISNSTCVSENRLEQTLTHVSESSEHSQNSAVICTPVEASVKKLDSPSQESCSERNHDIQIDISQKCESSSCKTVTYKSVKKTVVSQDGCPDLDMEVDAESGSEECSDVSKALCSNQKISSPRSWTKNEDKVILQMFQADIHTEQTFHKISEQLPQRSMDEIQERFDTLMQLLQRMTRMKMEESLTK